MVWPPLNLRLRRFVKYRCCMFQMFQRRASVHAAVGAMRVAHAPHKSPDAATIKIADKTANSLAIAKSPPPWPKERKLAYVKWARAVESGLPFKPSGLLARFEEAARLATESIEQQG
jgi:hypothetical protein